MFKTITEKNRTVRIIVILIGFILFIPPFLIGCSRNEDEGSILNKKGWGKVKVEDRLRVLTFNIKNGGEGIFSEENRRPRILELLKDYYPDIIGYQEVTMDWIEWFQTESFSELYSYYGKPREPVKANSEYSLIMYNHEKFTLKDSGDFWLNEDVAVDSSSTSTKTGWDASRPRNCTWILLEDNDTKSQLVVMNTHFDHKGMQAVIQSAELLLKMADQWEHPVVITGDFNSSETSTAYETLLSGNYENVKYIAKSTMSWATSPGFINKGTQYGEVIDHILIRKNTLKAEEYKVITEDYGGGRVSDHYPVLAEFTLD
jgi:endonuclease/exonuclease/phosphatase family metal-dependent hydrolase